MVPRFGKILVAAVLLCFAIAISALAQPVEPPIPGMGIPHELSVLELKLGFGLQIDSGFSLLSIRAWFNDVLGVEAIGGAFIVPSQITIRVLWKALETEIMQFYLAPGCSLREDGFGIHVAAGTQWSIAENVCLNLEVGLGYIPPGGWLPPGPVPFIGGSPVYVVLGAGMHFYLTGPWFEEGAHPMGPPF